MDIECIELLENQEDEKPPPKQGLIHDIKDKVRNPKKNSNGFRAIRMDSPTLSNILYWSSGGRKFFVVAPKCGH
jgi:hypothetical protein